MLRRLFSLMSALSFVLCGVTSAYLGQELLDGRSISVSAGRMRRGPWIYLPPAGCFAFSTTMRGTQRSLAFGERLPKLSRRLESQIRQAG